MKEPYNKLKDSFFKIYPDFSTFSEPLPEYADEERNYKDELHSLFIQEVMPRLDHLPQNSDELEQLGIDIASFFSRKLKSDGNKPQNLLGWRYFLFTQGWTSEGKIRFAKSIAKLLTASNRDLAEGFQNFMDTLEFLAEDSEKFELSPASSKGFLYFIKVTSNDGTLHKIGITVKPVKRRFQSVDFKLIAEYPGKIYSLFKIEQNILSKFKDNLNRGDEDFDGRTETFLLMEDEENAMLETISVLMKKKM